MSKANPGPLDSSRRQVLDSIGLLSVASLLGCAGTPAPSAGVPAARGIPAANKNTPSFPDETAIGQNVQCIITPEETAGPYPLDLSAKPAYFRKNLAEGKPGLPLSLALTVLDTGNGCKPLTSARVDVWHCDKDGVYSGYEQDAADTEGQTFCRGIQLTDGTGRATFTTIYPGWYAGRITHIHFQVYLHNGLVATSQLAFPEAITRTVYASPLYVARGQNSSVRDNTDDMVFADCGAPAMLTLKPNNITGGFDSEITVGIAVTGKPVSTTSQCSAVVWCCFRPLPCGLFYV